MSIRDTVERMVRYYRDSSVASSGFPSLGSPNKRYSVELTEPEVNAIHAATAFVSAMAEQLRPVRKYLAPELLTAIQWHDHYGPTLDALSERLAVFDDDTPEDAPRATADQPSALTKEGAL